MPRQRIDLEPYREQIRGKWQLRWTNAALCEWLRTDLNVPVSDTTLKRFLRIWGFQREGRTEVTDALRDRLRFHFFEHYLTDERLLQVLQSEGFSITQKGLVRLRQEMDLRKRHTREENITLREQAISCIAQAVDPTRRLAGYGREYLRTELRQQGFSTSRDVLYSAYKEVHQRSFRDRLDEFRRRRTGWTCPGPNFIWSIDAYDKLKPYGFEIYAGIDSYSRYIPWFFVGFSTHTSIGVGLQYLWIIRERGFTPRIIRADRGKETPVVAGLHWYHSSHTGRERIQPLTGEAVPIKFTDCFVYGKSIHNVKIESWWNRLCKGRSQFWRTVFGTLHTVGLFEPSHIYDQIALLYIYMEPLDTDLRGFVRVWNNHYIRKQPNRPHVVPGVPYVLFHHPEQSSTEDYGEPIIPAVLEEMEELLGHRSFDLSSYLSAEVLALCKSVLSCSVRDGSEQRRVNGVDIPLYRSYIYLREQLEDHHKSGVGPRLHLQEPPTGGIRHLEDELRTRGFDLDGHVRGGTDDSDNEWDVNSETGSARN
ncbi:hypothetical protein BKA56DRAFT_477300 [Ilyonectria sp. MPI-CAGE-AT-0026]|nr:hypothetical protein BKA56DRAFT_477300 [Ilyonectria sp. MPI-CAGE-AT-0026]